MRNSAEIKVWMLRNGHTINSITEALGYKNNSSVSTTIGGKRNARKVLFWLLANGCPEKYLSLPQKGKRWELKRGGRS